MKNTTAAALLTNTTEIAVPGTTPEALIEYFRAMGEKKNPFFQAWDMLSLPIEIFSPDGTLVYLNRAMIKLNNVVDVSLAIGKYNVVKDPVCNDQLGYREGIKDAFKGLKSICRNFPAPINDVFERGITDEKPYEAAIMDLYLFPVKKKEKLLFVVCEFHVRNLYHGRPEVAKAKEYIDTHWQEIFDKEKMAKTVGMSVSQLYKIFTEQAGMPPGDYHNHVKVRHIKDKLEDPNLSIKEAFAQCGESSGSWIRKIFKEIVGLSPAQYRKKFFAEDLKM